MHKETKRGYSWNRNAAHHRIAITRFAVFSFLLSLFVGLLVTLSMGIKSDGTRDYIVLTATLGLIGMVITFTLYFSMMGAMYKWILENDREKQTPLPQPKREVDVFYQNKDGSYYKAKPYVKLGQGE